MTNSRMGRTKIVSRPAWNKLKIHYIRPNAIIILAKSNMLEKYLHNHWFCLVLSSTFESSLLSDHLSFLDFLWPLLPLSELLLYCLQMCQWSCSKSVEGHLYTSDKSTVPSMLPCSTWAFISLNSENIYCLIVRSVDLLI